MESLIELDDPDMSLCTTNIGVVTAPFYLKCMKKN